MKLKGSYRRSRGVFTRGYTDTLVFVGLTKRETEEDFFDLSLREPERFLGFDVVLMSIEEIGRGRLRGMRITDYIMTERAQHSPYYHHAMGDLQVAKINSARKGRH